MVNAISEGEISVTVTGLVFMAASMVPASHYLVAVLLLFATFLYNFLEFHILGDFLRGFRGDPVILTFNPASKIYEDIISKCRILHGRYLATPWLSSPHFQTTFLNFFGRPPVFAYRRQLFSVHDGGTIALDWLLASDVAGNSLDNNTIICEDNTTPIAVIVPGLTSDSASPYVKHIAYKMAKRGWNVVVGNHRGLGGVSLTSDRFYNAGWTEDVREVVNYLNQKYPKAPIFAIGTSIGANILVKYLGEEGEKTPIAGAASICSPWDLVVCDRFICRKLVQRLYDRALTIGLQGYAKLHQPVLTRLANWDGIWESRSVRDFDHHATCYVGKFETVDTYYRCCSSAGYVGNVSVPLLCISALDDPVCTREAIPWDECRANKNIILATTTHGGHLAYFEGITASSVWWVKAVDEFLAILHSSPYMHGQKLENQEHYCPLESSIDKCPYVNILEDGFVAATRSDGSDDESVPDRTDDQMIHLEAAAQTTSAITMDHFSYCPLESSIDKSPHVNILEDGFVAATRSDGSDDESVPDPTDDQIHLEAIAQTTSAIGMDQTGHGTREDTTMVTLSKPSLPMEQKDEKDVDAGIVQDVSAAAVRRCLKQLSRQSRKSMWLLVCIAIMSSWPVVGSVLLFIFRNKLKGILPESMPGRKK